jgi:hypothetical protein
LTGLEAHVTDHFIEALLALGALLAGAAAVIKASASYKLARARLEETRAPWAAKIERLATELTAQRDKHNETRERVARLEGHRNGQRHK